LILSAAQRDWFLPVNWIDLSLILVLLLFGVRGYFKGLFREVLSLSGLVLGFMVAVRYNEAVAAVGETYWDVSPLILKGAAFIGVFFIVYFLLNLVGWLLHRSERALFFRTFNRVGGVAIGISKGAAVMALIVLFVSSASWIPPSTRNEMGGAYLVSPLARLGDGILRVGKEKLFPKAQDEAQLLPSVAWSNSRG
jgi:membrane protein required for colicin V production